MNDFARLEFETMARARAAIEPAPDDHARVRRALAAKILAAGSLAAAPSAAVTRAPEWRRFVRAHWVALGSSASAIAVIAFCAGYIVGHHTSTVIVKTMSATTNTSVPMAEPTPASAKGQTPAAVSSSSLMPMGDDAESSKDRSASSSTSIDSSLTDSGRGGAHTRVAPGATPTASTPDNSLTVELALLQRAEHTIRAGEPQVALGFLRDLDERFPKGQLMQERTAARVMANCQLDDTQHALARGRAYLSAHPRSVYAERVRSLCHLESAQGAKVSPVPGD